jgi:DNA mismatch repair protein MutL
MSDIIKLLPDSVANQIAAGEVIQRPASAVKELMENALDSGADRIQVVIKEAGKTLLQVIDNGCGMSASDARMSFERHATSKINRAEDLFSIKSMGFRGEALASIAAVAMVEMKTRKADQESGTTIEISGSKVERQDATVCSEGTSVSVKNLFFNIPARRNFLKSNTSETRHIVEEFQRISMAHPEKSFSLMQDGVQVFNLVPGNLKQRIAGIYGSVYNERVVPVQEETTILNLEGFIVKPEFARKTRGEQYIFVNRRFIKSNYINHAVTDAFEDLLPSGTFPSYFLFIEIDPAKIDINIHPTKTEIKFDDERSVYAIIRSAVKRALGRFSITPSLDFDQETAFNIPVSMYSSTPKQPEVRVDKTYNPFHAEKNKANPVGWERILQVNTSVDDLEEIRIESSEKKDNDFKLLGQIFSKFILVATSRGLMLVDQRRAHERILYERHSNLVRQNSTPSQQELFPLTMDFPEDEAIIVREIGNDLRKTGFDIREFGGNTFVLNGVPMGTEKGKEKALIEGIIESYKNQGEIQADKKQEALLKSICGELAMSPSTKLSNLEMDQLLQDLFNCIQPETSPFGKKIFTTITEEELDKKLKTGGF